MATNYSPFSISSPAASSYIGGVRPASAPMGYPAATMGMPMTPGYTADKGLLAPASNTVNTATLYPITSVIEDPSTASHLSFFFISNSNTLLKVGASPFGRSVLSFLAGAVPLFTSSAQSQVIHANMDTWVNRADLLRTGMDPSSARVLQTAGLMGVANLARYASPMDQAMLAAKALPIAASMGLAPPSAAAIGAWARAAQQLPPVMR